MKEWFDAFYRVEKKEAEVALWLLLVLLQRWLTLLFL